MMDRGGALSGLRVVELAGIGPAPHAAMMLSDFGAEVVRVERPNPETSARPDPTLRGRTVLRADLKRADAVAQVLALVSRADVLIEGFRPGVAERLGIGPEQCLEVNPTLVYGRVTGWGQEGPLALTPGHDLNFIGITGVLHAIGDADRTPPPPLNVIGDFGAGSMLLLSGILLALLERERSGMGQVVDAAMVDGVVALSHSILALMSAGDWSPRRHDNLLDGGAPFYDTYACADGKYVAVGAIEAPFFAALIHGLGVPEATATTRWDRSTWPKLRALIQERFSRAPRDEWVERFAGSDACVTPVLTFDEAAEHPHMKARGSLVRHGGTYRAEPAPRLARTPACPSASPAEVTTFEEVLASWEGSGAGSDLHG